MIEKKNTPTQQISYVSIETYVCYFCFVSSAGDSYEWEKTGGEINFVLGGRHASSKWAG